MRAPSYVAGCWAFDLFLGRSFREHKDLEIAVPHERFGEFNIALAELVFFVIGDGIAWPLATAGINFEEHYQTWGREPSTGKWRIDIFREPSDGGEWVCRRDPDDECPTTT